MERVAWYPVGLYNDQKRARSRRLCYTVITVCLMAGTVALVVSWLLATGIIDPDRKAIYKEARGLDYFGETNKVKNYPNVVKTENASISTEEKIELVITGLQADVESVTETEQALDNDNNDDDNDVNIEDEESIEVATIVNDLEMRDNSDTMEMNDEAEVTMQFDAKFLEENFQVSAETEDDQETTIMPEEIEITTTQY